MINIEKNVEDALYKSAYQGLKIYFEPLKGKPFHITSLDIVEGSFQIKKTATSTNNMQIGNMSADDLSMELMNPTDSWGIGKFDDVYFCGATMRLYLLVYDQTQDIMTETPFGVYIIDNQPRALDTIKITAFSNVIRLDTPFKASELPTAITIYDLVDTGLEKARLGHDDSIQVFPNGAFGLLDTTKIKSEQTITWRQVIKWCCECAGVNAISDENGVIKFVFYDKYTPDVLLDEDALNLTTEDGEILLIDDTPTTDFQLTPALRYADNSSEVAEEDVVITGFQFKVDDALYPEDAVMDYGLQSENNIVFYALLERARRRVAKTVNDKLAGFTYRPFKCNTISFPHLQTCDSVVYIKDGKQYHSIITDIVYKLNGDMTLTAKGKNKEQKAWEVLGALTPKQQAIIDSVSRKVDNTRQQLSSYENALLLFNEKMLHSMGLYKTVETDANGGMIVYFHDKSTLSESNAIYMFGASGFAWTTTGWNNGNPVWHYGFTDTGDAIFNEVQAYKISADLIQTGTLRSENGASEISLRNGTFSFRSATQTGTDANDNPIYSYEDRLKLDNTGELGVYGTLRSTKYTDFSVSIGKSEYDNIGSLIASYSENGYGDIFQVSPAVKATTNEKGTIWSAPFLTNSAKTNRKGIAIFPNETALFEDYNGKRILVSCKDGNVEMNGTDAFIRLYRDQINISTNPYNHSDCWFNYYKPERGKTPTAYKFGNGNGSGGLADVYCAGMKCSRVDCSGQIVGKNTFVDYLRSYGNVNVDGNITADGNITTDGKIISKGEITAENGIYVFGKLGVEGYFTNYKLSVVGNAKAQSWDVVSDPDLKENVVSQDSLQALDKVSALKFYSYDIKKEVYENQNAHTNIGIMADEAPTEIQSSDGKGIDLYAYISLTAKALQELSEKVEQQAQEIAQLKVELSALKQ